MFHANQGLNLTQIQKLANVTQFLQQIKYVFTEQYLQGSQTFSTQVLAQRFASVFILLYFTFNEQSTKIQSKCFEKIFVDLLDQVQENSSNCMNKLECRKWSSFEISAED